MHGTYVGNDTMLVKTVYNGLLTISSNDRGLMPLLVANGGFEFPLTKYIINELKPGGIMVDVGANVGYYTLLAALMVGDKGKVYAFEASPSVYTNLKQNLEMNWADKQVEFINKAVYSRNETLTFHDSINAPINSSINKHHDYLADPSKYTTIEVEAVRLDDILAEVEKIDLMKMDIEGAEYRAFLGMMQLIKSGRIKQIVFEWNKPTLGNEAGPFHSLLKQLQMELSCSYYSLNNDGFTELINIDDLYHVDFYPFVVLKNA